MKKKRDNCHYSFEIDLMFKNRLYKAIDSWLYKFIRCDNSTKYAIKWGEGRLFD